MFAKAANERFASVDEVELELAAVVVEMGLAARLTLDP